MKKFYTVDHPSWDILNSNHSLHQIHSLLQPVNSFLSFSDQLLKLINFSLIIFNSHPNALNVSHIIEIILFEFSYGIDNFSLYVVRSYKTIVARESI